MLSPCVVWVWGVAVEDLARVKERLTVETPFWARHCVRVRGKNRRLVPLVATEGQLELDAILERQRQAGLPQRAIVLKARQVGISTWMQAKAVHRATLTESWQAVTVAHNKDTGGKLFGIAKTVYSSLPDDDWLKPSIAGYKSGWSMRFGDGSREAFGKLGFPDSHYWVDTASELASGRGATFSQIHGSEVAFWPDIKTKLASLQDAVPADDPETIIVLESTANGHNEFRELWKQAEAGESGYEPLFWPWWKEDQYSLPFANDAEKEAFTVGDGPGGDEEEELIEKFGLSLEQLHWRRQKIRSIPGHDVRIFHQEYPAYPEQAFLATGRPVFDGYRLASVLIQCDITDPKKRTDGDNGPFVGEFRSQTTKTVEGRTGPIEVADNPIWVPDKSSKWKLWLPDAVMKDHRLERPKGEYVIGVDVSGGQMEERDDPDYHCVQVVDHKTREQVAEYRSRIDPDLLAEEILLAALWFNDAWVAIERTGSHGSPVIRKLWHDFRYPWMYRTKKRDRTQDRTEKRLGWDTNTRTKPQLVAFLIERLREDDFAGIKSRVLASEMNTYTRADNGKMQASAGAYDDALMAYGIAQIVANETPYRNAPQESAGPGFVARSTLSSYDPR